MSSSPRGARFAFEINKPQVYHFNTESNKALSEGTKIHYHLENVSR
jgi:hypothetical protein